MNRRSYLCLYVYDNSKEFKIGIAGFSIYGTKSEKLRFYLGSSSRNFFSPPKLKMPPRALIIPYAYFHWRQTGLKSLGALIYNFGAGQKKLCPYMYNFGAGQKNPGCMCTP